MKELELSAVVQVLDTCGTPGYTGLLGYVAGFNQERNTVLVSVYTTPEDTRDNAMVMDIEISKDHLFVVGEPKIKPV